jgi:SET domain-containing protein
MKHLIIFFIIILGIIIIKCLQTETFSNTEEDYKHSKNIIGHSNIGSRGVFANRDYKPGEVLEVCPCIKQESEHLTGIIADYLFHFNETESLIAFGYCSMYNHLDDPNAEWEVINENQVKIVVVKNIKKGEEIFVSYGDDYWDSRNSKKNN